MKTTSLQHTTSRRKFLALSGGAGLALLSLPAFFSGLLAQDAHARDSSAYGQEGHGTPSPHVALPQGIIGISLHVSAERIGDPAALYVGHIHPDGPAGKAGLQHGEEIIGVDGVPVRGKTYPEVVKMIRGSIGSSVALAVKGTDGDRIVTLKRVAEEDFAKKKTS
jgi:membrane-associated protease RseP (regulator of RpoE activity)